MRKFTQLKAMLVMLMMMVGMSAWAETKSETFEKQTAGTNYQSTQTYAAANSVCETGWEIYYGTVSTSSKITGNNSAALRLYSTGNNYGYIKSTTAIKGLTKVSFNAKASGSNGAVIKFNVDYSTDGKNWASIKANVAPGTSASKYEYAIPSGGQYIKITISSSSTKPKSSSAQLTIDDVEFTYTTAIKTLSSISLSGTQKTSFYTGEKFTFGGTVTASYEGNEIDDADVTAKTEFSGYNMKVAGTYTVTASYTENNITKTATYQIEVSDFPVTSGTYTIDLNNSSYEVGIGNNSVEQSLLIYGITVTSGCASNAGTKTYYDAAHIRYYADSYLKLIAPKGFYIKNVELVEPETSKKWDAAAADDIDFSTGVYVTDSHIWGGTAEALEFTFKKQCRIASVKVKLAEITSGTINLVAQGVMPGYNNEGGMMEGLDLYFATFSCDRDVIITGDDLFAVCPVGVDEGYLLPMPAEQSTTAVTDQDIMDTDGRVTGYYIPANTGAMIVSMGHEATYYFTVDDKSNYIEEFDPDCINMLHPASEDKTTLDGYKFYQLAYGDSSKNPASLGFYWGAADGAAFASRTGSAYLAVPAGQNVKGFAFSSIADAIKNVETQNTNNVIYNLQGQRVDKAQKGLYIVNGKKVVIK